MYTGCEMNDVAWWWRCRSHHRRWFRCTATPAFPTFWAKTSWDALTASKCVPPPKSSTLQKCTIPTSSLPPSWSNRTLSELKKASFERWRWHFLHFFIFPSTNFSLTFHWKSTSHCKPFETIIIDHLQLHLMKTHIKDLLDPPAPLWWHVFVFTFQLCFP